MVHQSSTGKTGRLLRAKPLVAEPLPEETATPQPVPPAPIPVAPTSQARQPPRPIPVGPAPSPAVAPTPQPIPAEPQADPVARRPAAVPAGGRQNGPQGNTPAPGGGTMAAPILLTEEQRRQRGLGVEQTGWRRGRKAVGAREELEQRAADLPVSARSSGD